MIRKKYFSVSRLNEYSNQHEVKLSCEEKAYSVVVRTIYTRFEIYSDINERSYYIDDESYFDAKFRIPDCSNPHDYVLD